MFTINCKGKILSLENPLLMGIVNVTPDSFYQGHLHRSNEELIVLVEKMIANGADIIDIGGLSTKPGSIAIGAVEEMKRVVPVISAIHKNNPEVIISIDTFYSVVAEAAVDAGASMVNDISAGNMDASMIITVAKLKVPYVCMHMQEQPATMQQNPHYNNLLKEILDFFINKIDECNKAGIVDVIIDPGFGFGKTIEHNFSLLKNLSIFSITGKPILAGLSRKSTIYKTLGITVDEALNGSTVLNTMALMNGANILRVHDVKEAKEAIKLFTAYKKAPQH